MNINLLLGIPDLHEDAFKPQGYGMKLFCGGGGGYSPPPPPPPRPTPPIPEPVTNTSPPVSTTTESNGRQCPSEGKEPTIIQNDKDYRLQTRIFHPDKNRDCQREAHEKMQKLNTMYQNYQKLNPRGGKHKKKANDQENTQSQKKIKKPLKNIEKL